MKISVTITHWLLIFYLQALSFPQEELNYLQIGSYLFKQGKEMNKQKSKPFVGSYQWRMQTTCISLQAELNQGAQINPYITELCPPLVFFLLVSHPEHLRTF